MLQKLKSYSVISGMEVKLMPQLYKSYMFKDKDPIIDKLRTAMADAGITIKEAAAQSGVPETTLWAWFYGMTRRPQHATLRAVFSAIGYRWEPEKARSAAANVHQLRG
jgi:predicted transcriptional regulator